MEYDTNKIDKTIEKAKTACERLSLIWKGGTINAAKAPCTGDGLGVGALGKY